MGSADRFCYRGGEKPQEGIDKPSNEQATSYFPSTLLCLRHPDSRAIGATRSSHATLQTSWCLPYEKTSFFFTSCRAVLIWEPYYDLFRSILLKMNGRENGGCPTLAGDRLDYPLYPVRFSIPKDGRFSRLDSRFFGGILPDL
jgi:hypothetical protein